jgi:hypothetical protein
MQLFSLNKYLLAGKYFQCAFNMKNMDKFKMVKKRIDLFKFP